MAKGIGSGFDTATLNRDIIDILNQNYFKVLCVNLKTKSHEDLFIKFRQREENSYAEDIDEWLKSFADRGFVYDEDVEYYIQNTDINFLRDYFEKYNEPFRIKYRRLLSGEYRWVEMVILKSSGYTKVNPIVILYVMDMEKYTTENTLENQAVLDCFSIVIRDKSAGALVEILRYIANYYKADDAYICDSSNKIVYEYKSYHDALDGTEFFIGGPVSEELELKIINPKERNNNHLLYRCATLIISRVLLDEEIEKKYIIESRQSRIISALSKRYFCIYRVDLVNNHTYLVYAPDYVKQIIGNHTDATEILGLVEKYLVHESYFDTMHEFNDYSTWNGKLKDVETTSREFKGTNRWARAVLIASKRDEDNNVTELLYAVQDIEEQKIREVEQDLKLREALKKANEANEAKSRFLSSISHDIRTPMNAIVGFSDLAIDNIDNKETVKEYLGEITTAGKHLVSLINDVLDMSHIDSGKITINQSACDIVALMKNIQSVMDTEVKRYNVTLKMNIENIKNPEVMCDEVKLNRILFNLIGNSAKYNKDGGYIKVSCKELEGTNPNEGEYVFTVEDSGIGMSREFLDKIFDTFERERDSTTSGIQGTGLGMSITKGLVELMGGKIQIESEKNVGTCCVVTLPLTRVAENHQKSGTGKDGEGESLDFLKDKNILLVEDNIVNQKLALAIFKKLGLEIDIAGDGKKALEALDGKRDYYDLIFMDMQMPNMDGIEATKAIRHHEDKAICVLPIIMMTANVFEEDKKKSFDAGANGFVTKPINIKELVAEMVRVLE